MKISQIDPPHLVAGSIPFHLNDIRALHNQGVQAIVSLTERSLIDMSDITEKSLKRLNICYYHSPIRDHYSPSIEQAQAILLFIERMKYMGRMTFIHCHAGVGRTGTLLHTYFLGQGLTLADAKIRVKQQRIQCILLSERQKQFLIQFSALETSA